MLGYRTLTKKASLLDCTLDFTLDCTLDVTSKYGPSRPKGRWRRHSPISDLLPGCLGRKREEGGGGYSSLDLAWDASWEGEMLGYRNLVSGTAAPDLETLGYRNLVSGAAAPDLETLGYRNFQLGPSIESLRCWGTENSSSEIQIKAKVSRNFQL